MMKLVILGLLGAGERISTYRSFKMKKLAILSLLFLPAAALAADDDRENQVQSVDDPNRLVCRNITQIGSRLARRRVCQTQAQWAEQERVTRADMENRQTRNCLGRCQE